MNLDEITNKIEELSLLKKQLEDKNILEKLSKCEWEINYPGYNDEIECYISSRGLDSLLLVKKDIRIDNVIVRNRGDCLLIYFDSFLYLVNFIKKYNFKISCKYLDRQISETELALSNLKLAKKQLNDRKVNSRKD